MRWVEMECPGVERTAGILAHSPGSDNAPFHAVLLDADFLGADFLDVVFPDAAPRGSLPRLVHNGCSRYGPPLSDLYHA